jgi:hypothetical protein
MMLHMTNPLRPAKTLCGRPAGATSTNPTCKRCVTVKGRLDAMGPELVAYWAGSVSSSVINAYDTGNVTTIHIAHK